MTLVTSRSNSVVARFRETRDGRDERCVFVEGRRLLEELLDSVLTPREAVATPQAAADPRCAALLEALEARGAAVTLVTPLVMEFLSDLDTPPGLAVRADKPLFHDLSSLAALGAPSPFFVLLDALQSPANVGAILRSAEAAGVNAVGIIPGTADPLSPKAIRASAGSAFRVPLFRIDAVPTLISTLAPCPTLLAADAAATRTYLEVDWTKPIVLLLGGEARGIDPKRVGVAALERIKIPMAGRVESLNVAVAAGILLMEARRQRTLGDTRSATA